MITIKCRLECFRLLRTPRLLFTFCVWFERFLPNRYHHMTNQAPYYKAPFSKTTSNRSVKMRCKNFLCYYFSFLYLKTQFTIGFNCNNISSWNQFIRNHSKTEKKIIFLSKLSLKKVKILNLPFFCFNFQRFYIFLHNSKTINS
jgi:hypothetical protein